MTDEARPVSRYDGRMLPTLQGAPIRLAVLAACVMLAPSGSAQSGGDRATGNTGPGIRPDGSIVLPSGWSLRPHGRQIPLASDLPIRMAWHPGGRWLAVQHAGYREHQVVIVDTAERAATVAATLPLGKTWSGMAWARDGERLYASGGVDDVVHEFAFDVATGAGEKLRSIAVGDPDRLDLVAGMAIGEGGKLFVCLQRSHRVVRVDLTTGTVDAEMELDVEAYPFECRVIDDGRRLVVSNWGLGKLTFFDAASGERQADVATGPHPSEMLPAPDGTRLFVSNANDNTVSVVDLEQLRVEETIDSGLYPLAPPGSTPNALAIDPAGKVLLVANADNNNCAVISVAERGESAGMGYIPLGWYPTSIRFDASGETVWVANGKGSIGSAANPAGPQPERGHVRDLDQYTGAMFQGSLSTFGFPAPAELQRLSAAAYACSPLRAAADVRGLDERPADSPIPAKVGDPSPIRHCVYVIKENRTYDQVFGDLPQGNGDAELCLFPREVTPNHHAIVEDFVLLDSFYVESEVSADGHEWTMGAYATDFVERTWPVTYGGKGGALGYPAEGKYAIAEPEGKYLFNLAADAGLPFRTYGEFVANGATPDEPGTATIPVIEGNFDPWFRGYDLGYRDVDRAKRFLEELAEFEAKGTYPRLVVLRLPNDHTSGTRVGRLTPRAMVADNDLALGMVLEGLSKSRFWESMAVFVVEDDAQNGPDHVDAHRTVAMVAGPYVRRGAVVSTMYSTCSMLRTMELILGLPPMSQFDAAARPMYDCFTGRPDRTPYACREAAWSLDERNSRTAWGAELSETFDLSSEDAADDLLLNEVVWRSVKGADSPMPMPRRAAFVRVLD